MGSLSRGAWLLAVSTWAVLVALLPSCASPAAAQQPDDPPPLRGAAAEAARDLTEGRRLYSELEFVGAVEAYRRALAVSGVGDAARLEAWEMLAASYIVLDREREAREAVIAMLALDPYHRVREPSGSPKIARFVEAVRADHVPDAALDPEVQLRGELPRAGRVGASLHVAAVPEGPAGRVSSVTFFVRGADEREWSAHRAELRDGAFVARIPARAAPDELELYAVARNADAQVVARAGEPLAPLLLPVSLRGAEAPRLTQRWWFWTIVGVAAIGAGVGIGVGVSGSERASPGTLAPGRVQLP